MTGSAYLYQEVRNSAGTTSSGEHFYSGSSAWVPGAWNFVEIWQKYNTPGLSDGFFKYKINWISMDKEIDPLSLSSILVRLTGDTAKHFDYSMLLPGVDIPGHSSNSKYRLLISEHYMDTTPQKVMLGNASTLAASKGGLLCPPSSWSNGSLSVNATNIPAGYNWVYVTNAAGETNSTGFPLGSGSVTAPPAAPTGVRATLQ
jgi:hypothetical protein